MNRSWLLVLLLLMAGVVSADEAPETKRVDGATQEQPETEAAATGLAPTDDTSASASGAGDPEAPERAREDAATEQPLGGEAREETEKGPKHISGMSILGNREAPKSLVIVPWKTSKIGDSLGIPPLLDDSRQPVDREVFLRALSYYEIRSETKP